MLTLSWGHQDLINAAGKGDVDLANILLERSDVEKNFQDEVLAVA